MYKELKNKSLKQHLFVIIVLFIISAAFLITTLPDLFKMLSGAENLDEMTASEIYADRYVEGTVRGIYGNYASTTQTSDSGSKAVEEDYIIPVGEFEYMGIMVPAKMADQCNTVFDQTWNYLDGISAELPTAFTIKGTIERMELERQEYFYDYVGYDSMSEEDQEMFLPYYIKVGYVGDQTEGSTIILCLIGLAFLIWGLFILIKALTGGYQKKLKKYCAQNGMEARIEQFYQTTEPVSNARVNSEYVLTASTGGTGIAKAQDVLWAYMHVLSRKKLFVITVSKSYDVRLGCRNGSMIIHDVKNEAAAKALLEDIQKKLPWVILGYTEQIENLFKKNRQEMIRYCDEKIAAQDPYQNQV